MTLVLTIVFVSVLLSLTIFAVDKAVQIEKPERRTLLERIANRLFNSKNPNKMTTENPIEVDVVKIFAEIEKKAQEVNPNLIPQIQSFNSNKVAIESYYNYLSALNHQAAPISSNKAS